mmetsp:Transcript_12999/g.30778  ORF Transcript_12999/g.30778 Transcript_12999/m.30778 type:complete len:434 (-) Transcript_12999:121-1422(-)|eukprot:CAMPEP_0113609486 /NCGR_PEP_ID=MMETSP0017_2-20120614/4516_1 /TAXON_ID=2856 /ORGANISM="Cylindrotheca closterium" /LENGTH=433 /DNA_ID=CAMNT_0000518305 /DNA_START=138 /DNA_END=1442 /DNA_ORIENTATION=- /assembly_acc=CAM_ASM_000147
MAEQRRRTVASSTNTDNKTAAMGTSDPISGNSRTSLNGIRQRRRRTNRKKYSWGAPKLGLWGSRILLLIVAAMYSTNFASVKYLETLCVHPPCEHDPSETSFARFLLSAIVCMPILYSNRQHWELILAGVEIGFWYTVNYVTQAEALELIPAGKCAFISALEVVSVPILARVFMGRKMERISIISAFIALFGVAILENLLPLGSLTPPPPVLTGDAAKTFMGIGIGDILALGQPLGFGYAVMRVEHYMEKFQDTPNRVLTLTAAQCITVCFLTFIWILVDCDGKVPDMSYMLETHYLIALCWTGIVTTVGACVLQGIALQTASATDAALIFSSEPVWGSLFAGWLLNERMNTTTYLGGFFIICACLLGSMAGGHDQSSPNQVVTLSPTGTTKRKAHHRLKAKQSDVSLSSNEDSLLPTRANGNSSDFSLGRSR